MRIRKSLLFLLLAFLPTMVSAQRPGGYIKRPGTQQKTSVQHEKNKPKTQSYNPQICPDANHPHMIDLGLPSGTKWACCNVGVSKPESIGGYYAWGETQTKRVYNWSTYLYGESRQKVQNIGTNIAGTTYDVARVKWGGRWQMPSMEQLDELLGCTSYKFTTQNGVKGALFTASNGNSIFIPAGGSYEGGTIYGKEYDAQIWTSTLLERKLSSDYDYCGAHEFRCPNSSSPYDIRSTFSYRCDGLNIRPVVGDGDFRWAVISNNDLLLCPDNHHPHMIDMGLPSDTKWSCCNIGASSPDEYGSLFAWGETTTKTNYDWSTYRWGSDYNKLEKYNVDSSRGKVDNLTHLEIKDDVAYVKWGDNWKTPSLNDLKELLNYTINIWTKLDGVNGRRFISKVNGSSIFLPATFDTNTIDKKYGNEYGIYWTSSINSESPSGSYELIFSGFLDIWSENRYEGLSVRPVFKR